MRELNCRGAHARACCMNQDALAHLKFCLSAQRIVRSDENFRHGSRFRPIEVRGNFGKCIFRYGHIFSLRAASSYAKDTLALWPHTHLFAYFIHLSGELETGNVRGKSRRRGITTETLEYVSAIQCSGVHTHPNPIGSWARRIRNLAHFESFNSTVGDDSDGFHKTWTSLMNRARNFTFW